MRHRHFDDKVAEYERIKEGESCIRPDKITVRYDDRHCYRGATDLVMRAMAEAACACAGTKQASTACGYSLLVLVTIDD
jgi:hypothetical protein